MENTSKESGVILEAVRMLRREVDGGGSGYYPFLVFATRKIWYFEDCCPFVCDEGLCFSPEDVPMFIWASPSQSL
jgi:hypothetical protein